MKENEKVQYIKVLNHLENFVKRTEPFTHVIAKRNINYKKARQIINCYEKANKCLYDDKYILVSRLTFWFGYTIHLYNMKIMKGKIIQTFLRHVKDGNFQKTIPIFKHHCSTLLKEVNTLTKIWFKDYRVMVIGNKIYVIVDY